MRWMNGEPVWCVVESGANPCVALDSYSVTVTDQLVQAIEREAEAKLAVLGLTPYADDHWRSRCNSFCSTSI